MKKWTHFFVIMMVLSFTVSNGMFSLINNNPQGTQQIDVQITIYSKKKCRLTYFDKTIQKFDMDHGADFCGYLNPGTSIHVDNIQENEFLDDYPLLKTIAQVEVKINERFFYIKNISRMCALEWRDDDLKVITPSFGNIESKEITELI